MKLPANESPLWEILKLLSLGCVAALLLHVNYRNGFQANVDVPTILGVVVTAASVDGIQGAVKRRRDRRAVRDDSLGDG